MQSDNKPSSYMNDERKLKIFAGSLQCVAKEVPPVVALL